MIDQHTRIITTSAEAQQAFHDGLALARLLLQDGRRVRITVCEDDEPLTHRQRKFYHGPVLGQVAEQVRVAGRRRYAMKAWKEYFRDLFTPLTSTEDLGVQAYSELIDKVIAHATTEWSVQFVFDPREREAVRWKPARRPQRRKTEEAIPC